MLAHQGAFHSITCGRRSPTAPWWAAGCGMRGTGLLLLSFLAYLLLGTGEFWALEDHMSRDPSCSFQRDMWELLQNYTVSEWPGARPADLAGRPWLPVYSMLSLGFRSTSCVMLNHLGHLMKMCPPAGGQLAGLLLFLLLRALLFSLVEGWSYVESFYLAFITLGTVGFGTTRSV